jgi:hypothetical protein
VKGRDEKLPDFRHGLQGEAAKQACGHGHAAPSKDTETLGLRSSLDRGAGVGGGGSRQKCKAQTKVLGKLEALLLSSSAKERLRDRGEQPGTVPTGAIGIDTAAMGKALESSQGKLNDVVIGRTTQAGHETRTAGVVVRMAPIGVATPTSSRMTRIHKSLLNGEAPCVQRRIWIRQINFVEGLPEGKLTP